MTLWHYILAIYDPFFDNLNAFQLSLAWTFIIPTITHEHNNTAGRNENNIGLYNM